MIEKDLYVHHWGLVGCYVSYMLGVPSLKAQVIGEVGSNYLLHQEYDTQNERGEWVHVTKEFQRDKWFIESYWVDNSRLSLPTNGD